MAKKMKAGKTGGRVTILLQNEKEFTGKEVYQTDTKKRPPGY